MTTLPPWATSHIIKHLLERPTPMAGFSWAEASAGEPDREYVPTRPPASEKFKRTFGNYQSRFDKTLPSYETASFDPTPDECDAMEAADRAAREKVQKACAHDFGPLTRCMKCGVDARQAAAWRKAGEHTENVIVGEQLSQDDVQLWGLDVTELLLDITEHVPVPPKPGTRTLRLVWICKETTPDGLPGTILNTPFEVFGYDDTDRHVDAHRERIRAKFEQLYKL